MTDAPEPIQRRAFLRTVFTGSDEPFAGQVAFHPLLARTVLLLAVFTGTVAAAQRVLNGDWHVSAVLAVALAGWVVVRIALKPQVRHRRQALAAFVIVVLLLGRRDVMTGTPLTLNTLAAAVAGVAAFAAVTHLPPGMFSRRRIDDEDLG
ncbi:hypothetical protein [Catellatospora sp. NPDC049609]|uniref:hypothetical protein n=1 Tax=Catellatospora sp. NPDC049609 TaxID=3155505 RepID=UPI003440294C